MLEKQKTAVRTTGHKLLSIEITSFTWPTLVRRRIQTKKGEDIHIPHPVDASEEGGCVLEIYVFVPLPFSLRYLEKDSCLKAHKLSMIMYLSQDEADNSHCCAEQGGEHQELETINDTLVKQTTGRRHGR